MMNFRILQIRFFRLKPQLQQKGFKSRGQKNGLIKEVRNLTNQDRKRRLEIRYQEFCAAYTENIQDLDEHLNVFCNSMEVINKSAYFKLRNDYLNEFASVPNMRQTYPDVVVSSIIA